MKTKTQFSALTFWANNWNKNRVSLLSAEVVYFSSERSYYYSHKPDEKTWCANSTEGIECIADVLQLQCAALVLILIPPFLPVVWCVNTSQSETWIAKIIQLQGLNLNFPSVVKGGEQKSTFLSDQSVCTKQTGAHTHSLVFIFSF